MKYKVVYEVEIEGKSKLTGVIKQFNNFERAQAIIDRFFLFKQLTLIEERKTVGPVLGNVIDTSLGYRKLKMKTDRNVTVTVQIKEK